CNGLFNLDCGNKSLGLCNANISLVFNSKSIQPGVCGSLPCVPHVKPDLHLEPVDSVSLKLLSPSKFVGTGAGGGGGGFVILTSLSLVKFMPRVNLEPSSNVSVFSGLSNFCISSPSQLDIAPTPFSLLDKMRAAVSVLVAPLPLSQKLEKFLSLLSGCGIARYIRVQLQCEICLEELTLNEDAFCYVKGGRRVARNKLNSLTWTSKYLKPAFPTESVHEAFQKGYEIV
uniref:Uncharacterized protein n=1 Tax=Glossina palpalis gambiensis TaxID=67801 RepID=A0A1B0BZI5_9MUSC